MRRCARPTVHLTSAQAGGGAGQCRP